MLLLWLKVLFLPKNNDFLKKKGISKIKGVLVLKVYFLKLYMFVFIWYLILECYSMGVWGLWVFYILWKLMLSIYKHACSTAIPSSLWWKQLLLNVISSQQILCTWYAMELPVFALNGFQRMRAFPFTFKWYSVLKRICILLRRSFFNFFINVFSMCYCCCFTASSLVTNLRYNCSINHND